MKKTLLFALLAFATTPSIAVYGQEKEGCPTIIVDGHRYTTDPCSIELTMIQGKEDKTFTFSIVPDEFVSYSFSVYDFGFPAGAILSNVSSSGARGTYFITVKVSNVKMLLEYTGKRKVYRGHLPIHIYKGSETGTDTNYLKLPLTITFKPDVKVPPKTGKK